jgi:hypothetical protein
MQTVIILTPGGGQITFPGIGPGETVVNGSGENRDGIRPGGTVTYSGSGTVTKTNPEL